MLAANTAGRIGSRLIPTVPGAGVMARCSALRCSLDGGGSNASNRDSTHPGSGGKLRLGAVHHATSRECREVLGNGHLGPEAPGARASRHPAARVALRVSRSLSSAMMAERCRCSAAGWYSVLQARSSAFTSSCRCRRTAFESRPSAPGPCSGEARFSVIRSSN